MNNAPPLPDPVFHPMEARERKSRSAYPPCRALSCAARFPADPGPALSQTRRMTSSDLFARMPAALATDILVFNHDNERRLYKAAIDAVAQARRVRPVFIERQPRADQHALMVASLGRPAFAVAADTLLRNWLLKKHSSILTGFLDALGIPHEKGVVGDLPKTVEDTALRSAVDTLLGRHPHDVVAVYLIAFNSMNGENWTNLDELLKTDPRLQLQREF